MSENLLWIETSGGPHALVRRSMLSDWRGIEGWFDDANPKDTSHYAQACRVASKFVATVPLLDDEVLVFANEAGDIAWRPGEANHVGDFVVWIAADCEVQIFDALSSSAVEEALHADDAECHLVEIANSDTWVLIDAAEIGDKLPKDPVGIKIPAGALQIRSCYIETDDIAIYVNRVTKLS